MRMVCAFALWLFLEPVLSHRIAHHVEAIEEANATANYTALRALDEVPNYFDAMDFGGKALAKEERGGICPSDCLFCCKKNAASSNKGFRCITEAGLACPRGRKCRNSYLSGSHKMSRFTTWNTLHQRIAMATFWRFVWYTEEEMALKPKQFKCPFVNTWDPVFRVPFSQLPFKELKSTQSWLEQVPKMDGGWLPTPKVPPTAFQCPHECIECCSTMGGFSCMLREQNVVPTNRDCKDQMKRKNADGFYVNCKLTAVEKKLPKKMRKFPSCANSYKCCCPSSDHWTQEVCMPPGTPQAILMESYRGTQELFLAAPEGSMFQNRGGRCVMPNSFKSVFYHTPLPAGGCCFDRVRYCCQTCDGGCCRYCWRCTRFEMIHTCSHNAGVNRTGDLFRRTASGQGTCMNNGPENNFTLCRHNNPDASGMHRYVPVAAKKYKLAGIHNHCPVGTYQFGADKQECRCESDKPRCQSKLWNAIGSGAHNYSQFRRDPRIWI